MNSVDLPRRVQSRLHELIFLLLVPLAAYLVVCLASYDPTDPAWSRSGGVEVHNLGGPVGAYIADIGLLFCGYLAYVFPLLLLAFAWRLLADRRHGFPPMETAVRLFGLLLGLVAGAALAAIHFEPDALRTPAGPGGVIGATTGQWLVASLGLLGATLALLAALFVGMTLLTGLSWFALMDALGAMTLGLVGLFGAVRERLDNWFAGRRARKSRDVARKRDQEKRRRAPPRTIADPPSTPELSRRAQAEVQMPLFEGKTPGGLPPLTLLDEAEQSGERYSQETLEALARQVELKLADFRIDAQVVEIIPGPVVTRFELQPAAGVKSSQISNLSKDLARGLSVLSVRVVDVIPGKSVIGLEIPNTHRETVYLSEILRSSLYEKTKSPLTLALGKDIAGTPVVADLAKMPHLLVAGTTGSGKSVALNAMILSVLYKASPEQVRLILIDPKMLELSVYDGIAHLLTPVVTDMKEAANALRWCVGEMERRYRLMAALGVRNLSGFNRKLGESKTPIADPLWQAANPDATDSAPTLEPLPNIVVVIDELADMMMIVGKKVEELIARLAQKARASGIHLILATQRPSVDVITGLIKANIPARMAFQVSSRVDSRTILDQMGAENLLGHGDMLFLPPGKSQPERIHGAFVDDHEVHRVAEFLRSEGPEADYIEDILAEEQTLPDGQSINEAGLPEASSSDGDDELYDKAVYIVTKSRRASISHVQRRLRIGYNRAARLIEEMEEQGVVSPPEHNGAREVLAPAPPD